MRIEIKNVNHSERQSDETHCFAASLYVDGKSIGEVSNRGHGGPDEFRGDNAAYARADQWCRQNLPGWELDGIKGDTDLEMHIATLVDDWLIRRDFKYAIRRYAVFIRPGIPDMGLNKARRTNGKAPDESLFELVRSNFPGAVILNTLPEAEALAIFKKGA